MYRITHKTHYDYSQSVANCYNVARLVPRDLHGQTCRRAQVLVDPTPSSYREFTDHFGNRACYFEIQKSHQSLSVTSVSEVEITAPARPAAEGPDWKSALAQLRESSEPEVLQLREFMLPSRLIRPSRDITRFTDQFFVAGKSLFACISAFNSAIFEAFDYDPEFSDIATPLADVMRHKRGVCQDFAQLAIAGLRSMGLPAAYISGYLETVPPPGKEKLRGSDASHAWFQVYIPELGWQQFDPTNNMQPAGQHVVVGFGRDYADVAPLRGVIQGGGQHKIKVAVDVEPMEAGGHGGH